jgi:hypothetical protein
MFQIKPGTKREYFLILIHFKLGPAPAIREPLESQVKRKKSIGTVLNIL